MAEHTSSSITIEAAPADVMGVIADFARYPEWTGEVKEAEVLATDADGPRREGAPPPRRGRHQGRPHPRLHLERQPGQLDAGQVPDAAHPRRLVHARRRPAAGSTEVTYQLTVDVKIPMLGMIKRKAEKVIIDRALAGLKKRVESGPGDAGRSADGAEKPSRAYGPRHRPRRRGPHHRRGGDRARRRPQAAPGSPC